MKKCSQCNKIKPLLDFPKQIDKIVKYKSRCKQCAAKATKNYRRTHNGLIHEIYNAQKKSSKKRQSPKPKYTIEQLKIWCLSQPIFYELFDTWIASGYKKLNTPSIDRKNNHLPYEFSNIQLMSWAENKAKGHYDSMTGDISTGNKFRAVIKLDKNYNYIDEYISTRDAARKNNADQGNLWRAINKNNNCVGFKWMYREDYEKGL